MHQRCRLHGGIEERDQLVGSGRYHATRHEARPFLFIKGSLVEVDSLPTDPIVAQVCSSDTLQSIVYSAALSPI